MKAQSFGEERRAVMVYMPRSMQRALKVSAAQQDISMSEIVRRALQKELGIMRTEGQIRAGQRGPIDGENRKG